MTCQLRSPSGKRLGFACTRGDSTYVIMTGSGCRCIRPGWERPGACREENNPFGVFIRTPDVDAVAARVDDLIIRPGGVLRHREWGLYEFGISGPDGLLVRVGWRSQLIRGE